MVTETKSGVMECLMHAQANAIALYLNNKRYHWYTYGQHFRDLHLFFDEMANSALSEVDPLGERIRMLGGDALSDLDEIRQWVTVEIASGRQTPRQMLEQALANERRVIDEMRTAAILADEQRDPGSNDLFSALVQNHEKNAWFIEETLRQDTSMGA